MASALVINLALSALICGLLVGVIGLVVFWLHDDNDDDDEEEDGGDNWRKRRPPPPRPGPLPPSGGGADLGRHSSPQPFHPARGPPARRPWDQLDDSLCRLACVL